MYKVLPAGRYYVGDLCYVMHDVWDEFCEITIEGHSVLDGVFSLADGRKFATFGTMYGDGTYRDAQGKEYPVDAGLIGCIRVEDITDPKARLELGNVFDFTSEFACDEEKGYIYFGQVCINTSGDEEDDDYDDGADTYEDEAEIFTEDEDEVA